MRKGTIPFGLPPFQGWVKRITLACAGVYLVQVVLMAFARKFYDDIFFTYLALIPQEVVHGKVWQVVTYSFLHASPGHIFFNMLTLWFMGSLLEANAGSRRFIECYSISVVGGAFLSIAVSYTGFLGMRPINPIIGASGGIFGILIAIGMLYGDAEFTMLPIPFTIRAKYLVGIWIFFAIVAVFLPTGGVAVFAHLGGLLFGFLWVKFLPSRGISYAASERYFGVRNSYYRWKRRRAARKFEVYMRDHDRKVTFDEHGNYVPPEDNDKTNGGSKSGWVN